MASKAATFKTANEAQSACKALMASGKITAWCDCPCFGKFTARVQINGNWFNLRNTDLVSV